MVCSQSSLESNKTGLIGMLSNQIERYKGSKLPQHVGPTLRRVTLPNGKVNGMSDEPWRNSVKIFKNLLVTPHNRYREEIGPHFSFAFREEGAFYGRTYPRYGTFEDLLDMAEDRPGRQDILQLDVSEDMAYEWEDLAWKPYPTHRLVGRYMCCLTCASLKWNERCPCCPEGFRKIPPRFTNLRYRINWDIR